MEASAVHHPGVARRALGSPLLRLRSDEQLITLFREGSEEAFTVIHDRYRQRLFAYVRQMMSSGSRADAEDVLQDVFVRAYGALRTDAREINLRAWLYRVAHNRCIDHLRRPTPPAQEIFDLSRTPLQDPVETAQRRDDLKRLVEDVGRLPEQQRSALLMREIDGLAYCDIALALDVTVPAVKSLLVRARVGLVEAIQARDTDCEVIRGDLMDAYDRGVKASGRSRRHIRECQGCREYKLALRSMKRSFAQLSPIVGFAPLAMAAKALGLGSASGGGAVGISGAGVATTVTAGKVCVVVCTAALATGGAVEYHHLTSPSQQDQAKHERALKPAPARHAAARTAAAPVTPATIRHRTADPAPVLVPIVADPPTADPDTSTATVIGDAPSNAPSTDTQTTTGGSAPTTSQPNSDTGGSSAPGTQPTTSTPPTSEPPSGSGGTTEPSTSTTTAPSTTPPTAPSAPAEDSGADTAAPVGGPPPDH